MHLYYQTARIYTVMSRYRPGITEKRLRNRRFCKTEEAILKAFFDYDNYISVGKMAERAGVARSTFYHHHKTVNRIVVDYRNYTLNKYGRMAKRLLMMKNISTRVLYEYMLIFIMQNKKLFKILMAGNERNIFMRMIEKIKPKLFDIMRLPKNAEKLFLVYTGEVAVLIDAWCKNGADEGEIEKLLDEILYLTKTARVRLKIFLQ